jgi:hypothetical protein
MTLAERFNAKARVLAPNHADDFEIPTCVDDAATIDEIVFRQSEYLGGMALVILNVLAQEDAE